MDTRLKRVNWGKGNPRSRTSEDNWKQPYKWNRKAIRENTRYRVFCASLADVFDQEVEQSCRDDLWKVISDCTRLDWLLLTKRLNVMSVDGLLSMVPDSWRSEWPGHVWFGHSICTQDEADNVIAKALNVPAAVRFLSCEPLLEPLNLTGQQINGRAYNYLLNTWFPCGAGAGGAAAGGSISWLNQGGIHWIIVGGESGVSAREFRQSWAISMVDQCKEAKIPLFMKQMGSNNDMLTSGKGGDPVEWDEHLRVREFPEGVEVGYAPVLTL